MGILLQLAGSTRIIAVGAAVMMLAGATPSSAQTPVWPSERPPRPLSARVTKFPFPPYEIRTLSNGLQVVAVLHHEQPAISMRMLIRAGSAQEPSSKPGVAALAASLLDQGTTTRTAEEIADTIDTIGGGLGTGSGSDLTFANVIVMKDSLDLGLSLLSDVVRNPAFKDEEIERQREQTVSGLKVSYEDPDYIAGVAFDRLVYGFHPYGMPNNGTPESIAQITRSDLQAFHDTYFVPNNAVLAVVGDVTAEEAFKGVERVFGDWVRKDVPVKPVIEPPAPTRRVVVINKPDAVQTEIRVGHIGIPRKHPDYMALNLAIKILGGEGSNRLHRVLRTERGLTYGASADMDTLKESGEIVAETDTRSEATGEALRLIVDEFWHLQREPVGSRELGDAQAYLTGNFPLTIETPDAIALQVLNVMFYGLDVNELQTFRERVNAVTVEDIQRVARNYLKPDRLSIVLVGNEKAFANQLRGVGFGQFEEVPLSELDLASPTLRRQNAAPPQAARPGALAQPAVVSPADIDRARTTIAQMVKAKGGLDKLRSIRTISAAATTMVKTAAGEVRAETKTYIEYPQRFRVEAKTATGLVVQTYADGDAWVETPGGNREPPAGMREEFRASVGRDVIALLLEAVRADARVRPLPDLAVDGRSLRGVEVMTKDAGAVSLHIDPQSGLVMRESYTAQGPQGVEVVEEHFSDYRPVEGLQVAFKALVRRGGSDVIERAVTDFKLNVPLSATLFRKPS